MGLHLVCHSTVLFFVLEFATATVGRLLAALGVKYHTISKFSTSVMALRHSCSRVPSVQMALNQAWSARLRLLQGSLLLAGKYLVQAWLLSEQLCARTRQPPGT